MSQITAGSALPVPTPADEKRIARELSPAIAWPTLAMAVVLPATHWTIVGLGFAHVLSLWLCAPILVFTSYAHYTLVHESIHDNLVPGHPKLRAINTWVGWLGALGLGFNWPVLMRSHVMHHAHTNTSEDPDIVVKGSFGLLLVTWFRLYVVGITIPLFLLKFVAPAQYRIFGSRLRGTELLQASAVTIIMDGILIAALLQGWGLACILLLFVPTRLAGLLLNIFFQWLPHYPFDRTERYLNTRISLWPGGEIFTLQQNFHLMHHLWPSVPFYNYARLYARLRPVLVAKGSRIEGLMVGRYVRDLSRH